MTLTLRAVSLNDQALSQPITAHFDHQGGTIGRADHNTLALPDPERHISRQQAQILRGEGQYRIRNVGSANPIVVGTVSLGQGEGCALAHGDQVRIGGYLLEVIDDQAGQLGGATITRGRAAVDAVAPRRTGPGAAGLTEDPLAPRSGPGLPSSASLSGSLSGSLSAPLSSGNPFADLLGAPGPGASAPALPDDPFAGLGAGAGLRADSPAWAAPPAPVARLPDDFDPFAAPAPAVARPPTPAGAEDPFADLLGTAAPPSSLDDLFGLPGGAAPVDPLADFLARPLPPSPAPMAPGATAPAGEAVPGAVSLDPLAAFGAAPPPADPVPQGLAREADRPALDAAWRPPVPASPAVSVPPLDETQVLRARPAAVAPPVVPAPAPRPAPPVRPAAEPAGPEADALWAAFCEGAGLSLRPPQGLNPDLMRVMGEVMRAAVEGTLLLMAARAATKLELRAQVTVIQGRNNNPLKFSPDAGAALEQLLQPPQRGFLAGPAAMREAMDDLGAHTLATMSGTRAALEGVLARFAPGQLEAKLAGRSVMDSLLPMNRRARLWELYLQHHQAIHEEAQEDFHQLFGRAFLAAYEQQIDRFERERAGSRAAGP